LAGNLLSAATKGLRPYLALTVLCAAIFLPGLASIPPIDRDEARYMQASKQMLESGNYVDITFQDEPRNKKPVGIYWLQVLAVKASAVKDLSATWPYRLPSVLGAWLAVLATFHFGRAYFTPGIALAGAAMLATSLIVVVEAHIAKTDAALLAAVTLSMLILARFYTRDPERMPSVWAALLFWVALGTGILIKGPLILLVVGVSVIALCIADRRINWVKSLHPEFGVPVAAAVVLPWLLATSVSGGGSFLSDAFTQDLLPKLTGGQESRLPFGYAPTRTARNGLALVAARAVCIDVRLEESRRKICPLLPRLDHTKLDHFRIGADEASALHNAAISRAYVAECRLRSQERADRKRKASRSRRGF